jgi:hypothetical protein
MFAFEPSFASIPVTLNVPFVEYLLIEKKQLLQRIQEITELWVCGLIQA